MVLRSGAHQAIPWPCNLTSHTRVLACSAQVCYINPSHCQQIGCAQARGRCKRLLLKCKASQAQLCERWTAECCAAVLSHAGFLSRFEGASCPAKLLEEITIIDTPGVLSGEKQRIERNYNFIDVCEWFAARSDLILLLFDPYK